MSRDTLSDLLRSVRLRGAVFYYVSFRDRWCAEAPAGKDIAEAVLPGCEHVMEYHVVVKGSAWAAVAGEPPIEIQAGDVVIFPQGDLHALSSAPNIEPSRLTADWIFTQRHEPKPMPIAFHHGVVDAGTLVPVADADAVVVCGFLGCDLRPFNPLIAALPRVLHLPAAHAGTWVAQVIEQAVIESNHRRPGGEALLERLSEMLFVDAARSYLTGLPEDATGWLAGLRDRFVGRALELLHEKPEHAWSVEELSLTVGLSRSALYERFVKFLGQPPIQYLANWRVQLGAQLLRQSNRAVAAIALDVGYESEAAFSRAFKRMVGMPPAAWRKHRAMGERSAATA